MIAKPAAEAGKDPDAPSAHDDALDFQFLSMDKVALYVRFLETGAKSYQAPFDIYSQDVNFDNNQYPLNLCEFLAYKVALAYKDEAKIKKNLVDDHAAGIQADTFRFFSNTNGRYGDTQAYGFVLNKTAYLIFRGTQFLTMRDWATDFDTEFTTEIDDERYSEEQTFLGPREPSRHVGFALAFGSVRGEISNWLDEIFQNGTATKIVFSGHSLGGALAILAAHWFAKESGWLQRIGAVVTFGAPMVGNDDFQKEYDENLGLKDRTLRVEASLDLITILSSAPGHYRHIGHRWHLKKRPAYSHWRLYFFTPLWSSEEEAANKAKGSRKKAEGKLAGSTTITQKTSGSLQSMLVRWILKALWFVVKLIRLAIAAHSVNKNYALYLSTLSYQQLRQYFQKHKPPKDYGGSHDRLLNHLAFVRGTNGALFGAARNGPLKVSSPDKEKSLRKQFVHFIF